MRSILLIEVTPALAAELELLSQALGNPGADIAQTLARFDIDVQAAVGSYLGMTVTVDGQQGGHQLYNFTAWSDDARPSEARASLLVPLPGASVILYARTRGAFVDLAADLAWLTSRSLTDYVLDAHLPPPTRTATDGPLRATATINQALGVLVGRGRTLEQARTELGELAAKTSTGLLGAAHAVLASLEPSDDQI